MLSHIRVDKTMTKHLSRIKHTNFKKIIPPVLVIAFVAIGGTYLLLSPHAATPYVSTTTDSGTLASPASKVTNCSGSTDGTCVLFGTSSSGGGGGGGTQTTNCFPSPEACGYPDPAATSGSSVVGPVNSSGGSVACSSLTASGSVTAGTAGQTVQNLDITGTLDISADNVT